MRETSFWNKNMLVVRVAAVRSEWIKMHHLFELVLRYFKKDTEKYTVSGTIWFCKTEKCGRRNSLSCITDHFSRCWLNLNQSVFERKRYASFADPPLCQQKLSLFVPQGPGLVSGSPMDSLVTYVQATARGKLSLMMMSSSNRGPRERKGKLRVSLSDNSHT